MSTAKIYGLLAGAVLALTACDKGRPDPPLPQVAAGPSRIASGTGGGTDASVPSAESVLAPPARAASKAEPGTRSNTTLTRAEESNAMPVAGQANAHSAPLAAAARASAP